MTQQLEWRVETDADTLKRYAEIVADNVRLTAAKQYLEDEAGRIQKAIGLKAALTEHYRGKEQTNQEG